MIQQRWGVWSAAVVCAASFFAIGATSSDAGVVWFYDDYAGWTEAAGNVYTIDFETMPNGLPSIAGADITPEFNYTAQGVTFSGPVTIPFLAGNTTGGFGLTVDSSPTSDPNWIIADLVENSRAVAIDFVSSSRLKLYDTSGELIDTQLHLGQGVHFLGAVSDEPIDSVIATRGSTIQRIESFSFAPVPEPSALIAVLLGVLCSHPRRRNR